MAIKGLERGQISVVQPTNEVGVVVEALERIGLVGEATRDEITESVAEDFIKLDASGVEGARYPAVPRRLASLREIADASDSGTYAGEKTYRATYFYDALWTPGADSGGYRVEELSNLELGKTDDSWEPHVRVAVYNADSPDDPLLHFLDQPFDEKYAEEGAETQLAAIAQAKTEYEAEYPDFCMTPLNGQAIAIIGLMQRIKGEPMPLTWGYMYDATTPRKSVGGVSLVGYVNFDGGQLGFGGGNGYAHPGGGVGLSVGPKELESQAS